METVTTRQRLRYRFDNLMARGAAAQMLMLAVLSSGLILAGALLLAVTGLAPHQESGEAPGFAMLLWMTLMRSMDAGGVGGDSGSWAYLFVMLGVTLGGIFVLSTLIGVLNGAIGGTLDELRKGRSLVAEKGHTILLGWTPKVHMILHELAEANSNKPNACAVVMSERDKVEMDDEIRAELGNSRYRVVSRSGNPSSLADLEIVNPGAARAIVILSPEGDVSPNEADTTVLKAILAVSKLPAFVAGRLHLVAELKDERTFEVARMVTGPQAALVLSPPLISRLLVQTGRQSGLSAVYTELLDFGGCEIYVAPSEGLAGRTFAVALSSYDDSSLIGVLDADGGLHIPPPMERVFKNSDQVVVISEDDDTIKLNSRRGPVDDTADVPAPATVGRHVERTLVLGSNERLGMVLRELDAYVAGGSDTLVVGEEVAFEPDSVPLVHMKVTTREADITDRRVLDGLDIGSFHHVLVLCETEGRSHELADARTMVTLLHLRDIARKSGKTVPVTTEMLDIRNQELASVAEADDFIVSNTLVALVMAQVTENPHLVRVFEELFSPNGHEIYLKPASQYVKPGATVDFYTLVRIAASRNEVAIGYRLAADARNPKAGYGVRINPTKSERLTLGDGDKVVVLAAD